MDGSFHYYSVLALPRCYRRTLYLVNLKGEEFQSAARHAGVEALAAALWSFSPNKRGCGAEGERGWPVMGPRRNGVDDERLPRPGRGPDPIACGAGLGEVDVGAVVRRLSFVGSYEYPFNNSTRKTGAGHW